MNPDVGELSCDFFVFFCLLVIMFLNFSVCLFLYILFGFVLMSWWLFGFVHMICMMMKYIVGCMFIKSMDSDDSAMRQSCLKIKQVAKYAQGLS